MLEDTPPASDKIPWDLLLMQIHDRQLVPIIGPGLVTVEDDGKSIAFNTWLAPQLARALDVRLPAGDPVTLSSVACAHLIKNGDRSQIYQALRLLVRKHEDLPVPPGIADLAAISELDLFITSTFDGFLTRALRKARPGFKPTENGLAAFHPARLVDLPKPLPGTFIFHVLGNISTYPDFGVWEDDYLEFLCGLVAAPKDTLGNLFLELRNRSLLLIGSPFDDWIVRFFLRVAKQERLTDRRGKGPADYLAERHDVLGKPLVFYFDELTRSPVILGADPVAFAAELRQRWAARFETRNTDGILANKPSGTARGSVFISYSHDDLPAANALATDLRAAGIPVWLDVSRLKAGGNWEQSLQKAIKSQAALFLSLISAHTEGNPDRFVHQERQWAADVHVDGEVFYIPVIIDDTLTPRREPAIFARTHRHRLPGARLTEDFADLLRRYLDQYQTANEILDE